MVMTTNRRPALLVLCSLLTSSAAAAQQPTTVRIETPAALDPINVAVEAVVHRDRKAIKLVEAPTRNGPTIAVVKGVEFGTGTIELDVAGVPGPKAQADDRGFIGIAFHVAHDGERFQTFYLRPTNGRSDDQLRRNHSVQYTAEPEWPWHRLRTELPGQYESYADMVAGEWTRIKIVVGRTRAELYVNGATQPSLIINDLKTQDQAGGIALWIGQGTVGEFANLRLTNDK
jgi:hypothetical protein